MKKRLLILVTVLFMTSLCFGEMSIWLKNGTEQRVSKIVFKGQQADLYFRDGRIMTLSVNDIDLEASGIGAPVGTYGETKIGGTGPQIKRPPAMVDEQARQGALKAEWDSSDRSAVALRDIERFHEGEVVRLVDRKLSPDKPPPMDYYWNHTPPRAQVQDQAYVVIYKNSDGTFGKKMVDAATFTTNFKIQSTAVLEPLKPTPPPVSTQTTAAQQQPSQPLQPEQKPIGQSSLDRELAAPVKPAPAPESSSGLMIAIVALVGLAAVAGAVVAVMKRKKPFIDSSRFRTYEGELRDFEIEIWLKNGKTLDQLIDICVKKFYQDSPAALAVAMKIMKGNPKSTTLPYLIKQSGKNQAEAQTIYAEIERRLDWIRQMIQTVAHRTGISPSVASPREPSAPPTPPPLPAAVTQKTAPVAPEPQQAPPVSSTAPTPPPNPTAEKWQAWGRVVDLEHEEASKPSGLPAYFENLHKQLGTLGK